MYSGALRRVEVHDVSELLAASIIKAMNRHNAKKQKTDIFVLSTHSAL
jgi:hypothetical protein